MDTFEKKIACVREMDAIVKSLIAMVENFPIELSAEQKEFYADTLNSYEMGFDCITDTASKLLHLVYSDVAEMEGELNQVTVMG